MLSLAPGESISMEFVGYLEAIDRRSIIDILEKIKKNEFSYPFALEINYTGNFEPLLEGKTSSPIIIRPQDYEIEYVIMD